jgi:hypothetical protein
MREDPTCKSEDNIWRERALKAEQALADMADDAALLTTLRSFVMQGGHVTMSMQVAHEFTMLMAEALAKTLANAPNYMEAKAEGRFGNFILTVQRSDGPSAHDLRLEAEDRVRKLEAELQATKMDVLRYQLVATGKEN